MCGQVLCLCKAFDIRVYCLERFSGIIDDAGFLDEIVYAERGEEFCGSVGRKHMVRACKVITQRLRAVFAHKDGTGILDLGHDLKRVLCHDLQVLGSNGVGSLNSILHGIRYQNVAVVL